MRSNFNFFSDQKFRSLFYQVLVVGLFATKALRIITVEEAPATRMFVFVLVTASVTKLDLVACLKVFAILA